jgi:DNA invertase Pin-like site-specific DNA recombinase
MTVRLKGFFASFERLQTKERVITALEKSMKDGNNAGGGQMFLYGYDRKNKKLVINQKEAEVVKSVFKYYIEGHGTKVISNLLNEAGIPTKRNSIVNGQMTVKKLLQTSKQGKKRQLKL